MRKGFKMNQAQNSRQNTAQMTNGQLKDTLSLYLLTIQGTLSSPTLEAARTIHNQTAGDPNNVAAAQSLGDLSHMVYVPIAGMASQSQSGAGGFLILDVWDSMEGVNQFFANPAVQHQTGQIFATRDPAVWAPADGFLSYNLPAPYGQNNRIVTMVRGKLRSLDQGKAIHNTIVASHIGGARRSSDISHQAYLRLAPPNSPEALEFLAIDVFLDAAKMGEFFANPAFQQALGELFAAAPVDSVWIHPSGDWVEW